MTPTITTPIAKAVLITIDVHGTGPEELDAPSADLYGRFAHGRYTYRVGMTRILDMLKQNEVHATFFWPVLEATRCPSLLLRCLREGHEVASHGNAFENLIKLGEQEGEVLANAKANLEALTGTQILGFRAPGGLMSTATVGLLGSLGYLYDSSFLDDDAPYSLAHDGAPGMVELPWSEGFADVMHFRRRFTQGRAELALRAEFDAWSNVDGYACLSLSPRGDIGVGRAARLVMLQRLFDHMRTSGARLTRCDVVAKECSSRAGLVHWNGQARVDPVWA
jgi:hypothetical protein